MKSLERSISTSSIFNNAVLWSNTTISFIYFICLPRQELRCESMICFGETIAAAELTLDSERYWHPIDPPSLALMLIKNWSQTFHIGFIKNKIFRMGNSLDKGWQRMNMSAATWLDALLCKLASHVGLEDDVLSKLEATGRGWEQRLVFEFPMGNLWLNNPHLGGIYWLSFAFLD